MAMCSGLCLTAWGSHAALMLGGKRLGALRLGCSM